MNLNKVEVLKTFMNLSLSCSSEGVVNVGWVAEVMNSTPYYVRKRIKALIEEGYLEYAIRSGGWCEYSCEPYPPLKGYILTEKSLESELFITLKKEDEQALKEAFEIL